MPPPGPLVENSGWEPVTPGIGPAAASGDCAAVPAAFDASGWEPVASVRCGSLNDGAGELESGWEPVPAPRQEESLTVEPTPTPRDDTPSPDHGRHFDSKRTERHSNLSHSGSRPEGHGKSLLPESVDEAKEPEGEGSGGAWWKGVTLQQAGPVVRHTSLQAAGAPDVEAARHRRRREDSECTAGLRDPAGVLRRLPGIVPRTRDLFCALRRARATNACLQGLHRAGGPTPTRPPPPPGAIAAARRDFARCMGVLPVDAERHHPAAPWRFELFRALADRLGDSDREVPE